MLDTLRKEGLERDTLVIFLSDNGGPTKQITSRNDPFSGEKGSVLEGGIRVPFMLSWPGRVPSGVVEPRPVSSLDLFPTVLAAAGVPAPSGLDGVDLLPYLGGIRKDAPHPILYWRMGERVAVRAGRWKLLRLKNSEPFRLYDLEADEKESKDLAAAQPDRARELQDRWTAWSKELAPPRW